MDFRWISLPLLLLLLTTCCSVYSSFTSETEDFSTTDSTQYFNQTSNETTEKPTESLQNLTSAFTDDGHFGSAAAAVSTSSSPDHSTQTFNSTSFEWKTESDAASTVTANINLVENTETLPNSTTLTTQFTTENAPSFHPESTTNNEIFASTTLTKDLNQI
ncbi:hypothetical protein WMY93_026936 [Mugilogobius chulae]|uniref:Uncharacterized protein n=1 Tax=Mugilogobius chulae TaxID=88201 RepID=A0AAW0MW61_9GOBI